MKTPHSSTKAGFTLIELLVVSTIMIILTAIGLASYAAAGKTSRDASRRSNMESLRQGLVLYKADKGIYPAASGGAADRWNAMVLTLYNGGFFSGKSVTDPKNGDAAGDSCVYGFTYTNATPGTFMIGAVFESEQEDMDCTPCAGSPYYTCTLANP